MSFPHPIKSAQGLIRTAECFPNAEDRQRLTMPVTDWAIQHAVTRSDIDWFSDRSQPVK